MPEDERDGRAGRAPARRRRRSWAAGLGAFAALLSGIAAMTTAVAGIWRPPVPVPIPRVSITWPTPTPVPAASPAAAAVVSVATPTPPEPTPPAASAGAGYSANWSAGIDGWVGSAEWKSIPGLLVSDGTAGSGPGSEAFGTGSVRAPFRPATGNYAVDARIQIVDPRQDGCYVAMVLRDEVDGQGPQAHGYVVGYVQGSGATAGTFRPGGSFAMIDHATFSPGTDWHVYHAELRANQLTVQIDGSTVLQATDNNYLAPGQVGLSNGRCQVQVSRFTVTLL